MFQEEQQLLLIDVGVVVFVEVSEGFADRFPLLPNLVDKFLEDLIIWNHRLRGNFLIITFLELLMFQILLILWVPF